MHAKDIRTSLMELPTKLEGRTCSVTMEIELLFGAPNEVSKSLDRMSMWLVIMKTAMGKNLQSVCGHGAFLIVLVVSWKTLTVLQNLHQWMLALLALILNHDTFVQNWELSDLVKLFGLVNIYGTYPNVRLYKLYLRIATSGKLDTLPHSITTDRLAQVFKERISYNRRAFARLSKELSELAIAFMFTYKRESYEVSSNMSFNVSESTSDSPVKADTEGYTPVHNGGGGTPAHGGGGGTPVHNGGGGTPAHSGGGGTPAHGGGGAPVHNGGGGTPVHSGGGGAPVHNGGGGTPVYSGGGGTPVYSGGGGTPVHNGGGGTPVHSGGGGTPVHSGGGGTPVHSGGEGTPVHSSFGNGRVQLGFNRQNHGMKEYNELDPHLFQNLQSFSAYKRESSKLKFIVTTPKYLKQLNDACVSFEPCNINNLFWLDSTSRLEPKITGLLLDYIEIIDEFLSCICALSEQCDSEKDHPESPLHNNSSIKKKNDLFHHAIISGSDLAGPPKQSNTVQNQKAGMHFDAVSTETYPSVHYRSYEDEVQSGCSVSSAFAKPSWMAMRKSVTDESCVATQSVPHKSSTDNDLQKTEFTPVSFGAQALKSSAVDKENDVELICHGEVTIQHSRINNLGVEACLHDPVPPLHFQNSSIPPEDQGCKVLSSNVPEVFSVGDCVPCPSGVVTCVQRRGQERGFPLYYKQQAFYVVETPTPLSQLRRWSALHHGNVLMLSALLGECDTHPGTCYQLTPVVTGDLKYLMERHNLPSLMECLSSLSSDRADLVSWNVKYILREILKGLEYLHSKEVKIVHGDLKLHNILIDIVCNCEDIFQCPHEGESGYRVCISDFDKAAHIGEGGATEADDVYSFGVLLKSVLGISNVDKCTSVERECVGLEGLGDVVMACLELDPQCIPTASDLLKYPFFSHCPPPSALPRAVLPLSSEEESPPLAVQAQQQPDEDCKQVLGFKTPETLAHLLTSEHSPLNDLSTPDQPPSADEIQPHQPTSKPTTTSSSAVSATSGGKDSDQSCEQLVDGWKPPSEQPCFDSAILPKDIDCPPGGSKLKAAPSCNDTSNNKTEETGTPAHPLTGKHSQSTALYNPDESALAVVLKKTPTPTTPSTPSPTANTSEDRNEVRPGDLDDCQKRSMFPNNSTEERDKLMAYLFKEQRAREGNVLCVRLGSVVFTQCPLFSPGEKVPLPSKAAMSAFIGKGGNGVVSYVYHKGKEFAVKETCLREDELLTLRKLSHRNVMEISAVIGGERHERYGGRTCYQLMPRVTGDVKKLMDNRGLPTLCHYFFKFKTESDKASYVLGNAKFILREVLSGLQYLHQTEIVHRDVKLHNILIDIVCNCEDIFQCPHEGESGYRVYISDFDSAMDVERTRRRLEERAQKRYPLRYSVHGTPGYRPPEACYWCSSDKVISSYLSPSQDIWSFGCTLMKFFVGSSGPSSQKEMSSVKLSHCLQQPPSSVRGVQSRLRQSLKVDENEMKKLLKVSLLEKYFPLATELHDLAQSCLQVDPTQRPTVKEILKHPFFKVSNSSSS